MGATMLTLSRSEVTRIPSRLGDVILQKDTKTIRGEITHREIVMFVPTIKVKDEDLCTQS